MNAAVGFNTAALVYAAVTLNVPMLLVTIAIAAHQAATLSAKSPVTSAYLVTRRMAIDITSSVERDMERGAGHLSPERYGTGGHLDVTYVASDGETYRAIIMGDAFLDTDPVCCADPVCCEDPVRCADPVRGADPACTSRRCVMDKVLASYLKRDGKPLYDMMPALHMCAGPCGDFHASSMLPYEAPDEDSDTDLDQESDTEASSWMSSESGDASDLRCWMLLPISEMGGARESDRLVVVVKDREDPISLPLDSRFCLDSF